MNADRRGVAEAARQKAQRALRTARLSLEDGDADTVAAADLLREMEAFVEEAEALTERLSEEGSAR